MALLLRSQLEQRVINGQEITLSHVVAVDAGGIVVSTFQVVLAPIFLGVGFNTLAPGFCKAPGLVT